MSHVRRLSVRSRWAIVLGLTALSFVISQRASATPPGIPSRATAQSELDTLVVTTEGSMTGYSRELFPHWITVSGTCSAREAVQSDQDPSAWMPRAAYRCTYSKLCIGSKHAWDLRLQSTEKSALQAMLNGCGP